MRCSTQHEPLKKNSCLPGQGITSFCHYYKLLNPAACNLPPFMITSTALFNFHNYAGKEGKFVKYYPIFWDIGNKKCVVVGGGEVAARKVRRLQDCGANIFVVSPRLTSELITMKAENLIVHIAGNYEAHCLEGASLVIGATDDEKTNAAIAQDARSMGIPVNIVDDPQKCDFILPAVVQRGDFSLAIGTGGKSPALARLLREELEDKYGTEYEVLLNILGSLRQAMKNSGKGKTWFDSLLACGILDLIRAQDWDKVKSNVKEITGEELDIE
jgi:precorrin-2 dehydrogenase/sirohydrochlorin ferrochelatase